MRSFDSFPGTAPMASDERALLRAVRDLVAADRSMRRDLSRRMAMGETDLRALRYVMAADREGRVVTPHQLADHLGITSAATTVVLDRLGSAGHLERRPHPGDRRSKVVVATPRAYANAHVHLSATHDRMRLAAADVPVSARPAVIAFLEAVAEAMGEDGADAG